MLQAALSIMQDTLPYKEQLERIKRLREDISRFSVSTSDNFKDANDAFTSFFIQCYHLRDWLFQSHYRKREVDAFVNNNVSLSLCRDMANRQKHREINRYEPQNHFIEHDVHGIATPIINYYDPVRKENRFGIDVREFGTLIDVIELADKCIEDWERFLYFHTY
jgi:hypothetical protein